MNYNQVAKTLRRALFKGSDGSTTSTNTSSTASAASITSTGGTPSARKSKLLLKQIFNILDVNLSGDLSTQEMKTFVMTPELGLFDSDSSQCKRFAEMLVGEIDINRDGYVSLQELEFFLWPPGFDAGTYR